MRSDIHSVEWVIYAPRRVICVLSERVIYFLAEMLRKKVVSFVRRLFYLYSKLFKYSATDLVISLEKSELYLRLQKACSHSV